MSLFIPIVRGEALRITPRLHTFTSLIINSMKKLFILSLVGLASLSATAQETTLQETRFTDNWSVGLNGGIVTPLTHHAFWGNARSAVGVQLTRT